MSVPVSAVRTDNSIKEETSNDPKDATASIASEEKECPEVISQVPEAAKEINQTVGIAKRKVAETIEDAERSNVKQENSEMNVEQKENNVSTINEAEKASVENTGTQTDSPVRSKMIPVMNKYAACEPSNVAVPRSRPPLPAPFLNQRPLVLATHLVPSLPIAIFEIFAQAIEVATEQPVVLLYESRSDRPVAKGITDIAILPASKDWDDGELLPVSFCFKHHLNKENSAFVYVDVVLATDRAAHVEDIMDLRGHRCSLPDRQKQIGAAALLFNHLHTRGESPSFFGNTLDANTQVAALQMVAGKQAEVGVLESPVIRCHKNALPGVESLHILTSLGPLPPYRIMVNKTLSDVLVRKITTYLLNIDQDKEWVERFAPFGITSFAKNSAEFYHLGNMKSVVTRVPYY